VKVTAGLERLRNLGKKWGSAAESGLPKVGKARDEGRTKESRQTRGLVDIEALGVRNDIGIRGGGSQGGLRSRRVLRSFGRFRIPEGLWDLGGFRGL
jgi:hypothetical protein